MTSPAWRGNAAGHNVTSYDAVACRSRVAAPAATGPPSGVGEPCRSPAGARWPGRRPWWRSNDPSAPGSHFPACLFHALTGPVVPGLRAHPRLPPAVHRPPRRRRSGYNVFVPLVLVAVVGVVVELGALRLGPPGAARPDRRAADAPARSCPWCSSSTACCATSPPQPFRVARALTEARPGSRRWRVRCRPAPCAGGRDCRGGRRSVADDERRRYGLRVGHGRGVVGGLPSCRGAVRRLRWWSVTVPAAHGGAGDRAAGVVGEAAWSGTCPAARAPRPAPAPRSVASASRPTVGEVQPVAAREAGSSALVTAAQSTTMHVVVLRRHLA